MSAMPAEEWRRFSHVEAAGLETGTAAEAETGTEAGLETGTAAEAETSGQREVRISPRGGTLVVFDSVSVPHSVLETVAGSRGSMAKEPQR